MLCQWPHPGEEHEAIQQPQSCDNRHKHCSRVRLGERERERERERGNERERERERGQYRATSLAGG